MPDQITINRPTRLAALTDAAITRLGQKRPVFYNALALVHLHSMAVMPAPLEVTEIVSELPSYDSVKVSRNLKENIARMNTAAAWDFCGFAAHLYLLNGFAMSGERSANFYKDGTRVCFFAVRRIGGRDISQDVANAANLSTPFVVGNLTLNSDLDYFYFSKVQSFRRTDVGYPKWPDFISAIEDISGYTIPEETDYLKVAHDQLVPVILPALRRI